MLNESEAHIKLTEEAVDRIEYIAADFDEISSDIAAGAAYDRDLTLLNLANRTMAAATTILSTYKDYSWSLFGDCTARDYMKWGESRVQAAFDELEVSISNALLLASETPGQYEDMIKEIERHYLYFDI